MVIWKLDRLARSTHHLLEFVERIRIADASFCSRSEPWADTTSHAGKMIMTVFAGIAEFERDLIRERTSAHSQTDFLIIARTDAIAVEGFSKAYPRC